MVKGACLLMNTNFKPADSDYWNLSNNIYSDSYLEKAALFNGAEDIKNPTPELKSHNWRTVSSINDEQSGLQGAMVVPSKEYKDVISGKKKPSQAIFVSRGTEEFGKDLLQTDIGVLGGTSMLPGSSHYISDVKKYKNHPNKELREVYDTNQFAKYDDWVQSQVNHYQPKNYEFTGHSLGGGLAQYEAVQHNKKAVTFAAANPYVFLSEEQKKAAKNGEYQVNITNYRHMGDFVSEMPGGTYIGKQVYSRSSTKGFFGTLGAIATVGIKEHTEGSWIGQFNSSGNIDKIKLDLAKVPTVIKNIQHLENTCLQMKKYIQQTIDDIDTRTKNIYDKYYKQLGSGEYSELNTDDLNDIFEKLSLGKHGSTYEFYDSNLSRNALKNIHALSQQISTYSSELNEAMNLIVQDDEELAGDFKLVK